MKKNGMFYGAVVLTIAGLISKFLGAFYRVPLLAILGSEGLGMYQLVFPIFALMLVVGSSGVPLTLSKQISSLENENEHKKAGEEENGSNHFKVLKYAVISAKILH